MNFLNLEYYVAVVEEGSITKAAERLHVTQQALSSQIARMEAELGCQLFSRRAGLEMTYSGECFYRSAQQILDIQRQTAAAIDDANNNKRGELRIGISHTRGQAILPRLLPEFCRLYPLAELKLFEGSSEDLDADLGKGIIDILIGYAPFSAENTKCIPLLQEHMYLVAQRALLKEAFGDRAEAVCEQYRRRPDIAMFRNLPFVLLTKGDRIRTLADREFQRLDFEPSVKLETQNVQTAFCLAAEGMGLTICPEMYLNSTYTICGAQETNLRDQVEILPFLSNSIVDTIAIGYNKSRYLSQMAQDFIRISQSCYCDVKPMDE